MQRDAEPRRLVELVFLHRGPLALRFITVIVSAVACAIAGYTLFHLHEQLAPRLSSAGALNPLQTFIATGSSVATAWPGWLAALCFAAALRRLRRDPLEPAPGRRSADAISVHELRRGLRGEYRAVRGVLVVLAVVTAVDVARALAFAAGSGRAGVSLLVPWAVYVEALGLVVATIMLAIYAWAFGDGISRLGAV
ncbi:MAG: hypothetical protein ABR498_07155 [Candidatus Dormibacteria bacterium]